MAHADWLASGPIKSVLTGQYVFSIRMLDRRLRRKLKLCVKITTKKLVGNVQHTHLAILFHYL